MNESSWIPEEASKTELLCEVGSFIHYEQLEDDNQDAVIEDAEREGLLHPYTGSRIFEGTVGSTGISIATIARARYDLCAPSILFHVWYIAL